MVTAYERVPILNFGIGAGLEGEEINYSSPSETQTTDPLHYRPTLNQVSYSAPPIHHCVLCNVMIFFSLSVYIYIYIYIYYIYIYIYIIMVYQGKLDILSWPCTVFRLVPTLMMVLMFYAAMYKYVSGGPLAPIKVQDAENCKENWWTDLLLVHNLVNTEKIVSGQLHLEMCVQLVVSGQLHLEMCVQLVVSGQLHLEMCAQLVVSGQLHPGMCVQLVVSSQVHLEMCAQLVVSGQLSTGMWVS